MPQESNTYRTWKYWTAKVQKLIVVKHQTISHSTNYICHWFLLFHFYFSGNYVSCQKTVFYLSFFSRSFTIQRTPEEGEDCLFDFSLSISSTSQTPRYSRAITTESSPLHIASSWTRTGTFTLRAQVDNHYLLKRQSHKMAKHTQTIRRQIADELFEWVWPFC